MLFPTLEFGLFFLPVLILVWTAGQASTPWIWARRASRSMAA